MTNQVPKHFSACEKTGLVFLSFFFPYATIAIVEGFGVHFWCNLVASIIVFLVVFLFGVPSFFAPILLWIDAIVTVARAPSTEEEARAKAGIPPVQQTVYVQQPSVYYQPGYQGQPAQGQHQYYYQQGPGHPMQQQPIYHHQPVTMHQQPQPPVYHQTTSHSPQ